MDDELESGASEDSLSLSFLDVICCGMGAAVMLYLIFSNIKHQPPAELTAPPYISVRYKILSQPSDAFVPVIAPIIQPPGYDYPFDIHLSDFDLESTSKPKPPSERVHIQDAYERTGNYSLRGFSLFQDNSRRYSNTQQKELISRYPSAYLEVAAPVAGDWWVGLRYANVLQGDTMGSVFAEANAFTIEVEVRVLTQDKEVFKKPVVVKLNPGDGVFFNKDDQLIRINEWQSALNK